ncbi:hypothetical protein ANCDUO_03861 [Ancylostoma duodenale]|uniref:Uncharacterized protein n=1 Tax=Ancylostoma duodenale TaxID=51022 RepID=A0A0C2H2N4_9BILA|nr:hypothetical protein ANCDUO_03861 [Ancylostoma duodenale]
MSNSSASLHIHETRMTFEAMVHDQGVMLCFWFGLPISSKEVIIRKKFHLRSKEAFITPGRECIQDIPLLEELVQ